jgi:bacterioferritin-associated ferredoxin
MHDYLSALSRCQANPDDELAKYDLMRAFAELQFCIHGGAKCSVCNSHVRHVISVSAERADGTRHEYDCLCTRCFESERAVSNQLAVSLGDAIIYFPAAAECSIPEPHPHDLRRRP